MEAKMDVSRLTWSWPKRLIHGVGQPNAKILARNSGHIPPRSTIVASDVEPPIESPMTPELCSFEHPGVAASLGETGTRS